MICTLGPSSSDATTITKLIDNGMNIARIDLSVGDQETHEKYLEEFNKAKHVRLGKPLAVMVDLMGPSIRTGKNKDGKVISIEVN